MRKPFTQLNTSNSGVNMLETSRMCYTQENQKKIPQNQLIQSFEDSNDFKQPSFKRDLDNFYFNNTVSENSKIMYASQNIKFTPLNNNNEIPMFREIEEDIQNSRMSFYQQNQNVNKQIYQSQSKIIKPNKKVKESNFGKINPNTECKISIYSDSNQFVAFKNSRSKNNLYIFQKDSASQIFLQEFLNAQTVEFDIFIQKEEDFQIVKHFQTSKTRNIIIIEMLSFQNALSKLNMDEKYQISILLEKVVSSQSVTSKIAVQAILPFIQEFPVDQIEDIIGNSIFFDEQFFKVKIGDSFLIDLDIINTKDPERITLQNVFSRDFTQAQTKKKFLKILHNPTWNQNIILQRLQEIKQIQDFLDFQNLLLIRKLLKEISSITSCLKQMKKYSTITEDWKKFLNSLQNIKKLIIFFRSQFQSLKDLPNTFVLLMEADDNLIDRVIQLIVRSVDLQKGKSISIYDEVHQDLRRLRSISINLENILSENLKDYIEDLQDHVQILRELSYSIVNVPSFGYLLKVSELEVKIPDWYKTLEIMNDWQIIFQENQEFYFRNNFTQELYNEYGDLENEIQLLESKIIIQIVKQLIYFEKQFIQLDDFIQELDYNTTMCYLSNELKLCIPTITTTQNIKIIQGRHLLSEVAMKKNKDVVKKIFVPNDFIPQTPVTVITGPNYSGKSIFIKQIGLIVYLAHLGLPVPAKQAQIVLLDSMFSLFTGESSRLDVNRENPELINLQNICKQASQRSLIIIDELGKNLKFDIGSSLFSSTIQYLKGNLSISPIQKFYEFTNEGPFIQLATHYHSVVENDFNKIPWLEVLEMITKLEEDKSIIFTFTIGNCKRNKQSLALEIASQILKDETILKRGTEILEQILQRKCFR